MHNSTKNVNQLHSAWFCLEHRWSSHFNPTHHFTRAAPNSSAASEIHCFEESCRELSVMLQRYMLDLLMWEYGIAATSPPTLHSLRGMRERRWKEAEIRRRNKLATFLPPENSMCRASSEWRSGLWDEDTSPLRVRVDRGGVGGSEEDVAVLCSVVCWRVIALAGFWMRIVSSSLKPNQKHHDSWFLFPISKNLMSGTKSRCLFHLLSFNIHSLKEQRLRILLELLQPRNL